MLNAPGVDAVAAFDEIGQRFTPASRRRRDRHQRRAGRRGRRVGRVEPERSVLLLCRERERTDDAHDRRAALPRLPSLPLIPVWVSDRVGDSRRRPPKSAASTRSSARSGSISRSWRRCPMMCSVPAQPTRRSPICSGSHPARRTVGSRQARRTARSARATSSRRSSAPPAKMPGAERHHGEHRVRVRRVRVPGRYLEDDPLSRERRRRRSSAPTSSFASPQTTERARTRPRRSVRRAAAPRRTSARAGTTKIDDLGFTTGRP